MLPIEYKQSTNPHPSKGSYSSDHKTIHVFTGATVNAATLNMLVTMVARRTSKDTGTTGDDFNDSCGKKLR